MEGKQQPLCNTCIVALLAYPTGRRQRPACSCSTLPWIPSAASLTPGPGVCAELHEGPPLLGGCPDHQGQRQQDWTQVSVHPHRVSVKTCGFQIVLGLPHRPSFFLSQLPCGLHATPASDTKQQPNKSKGCLSNYYWERSNTCFI